MSFLKNSADQPRLQRWFNRFLLIALVFFICTTAIGLYNYLKLGNFLNQLELLSYDARVQMPLKTGTSRDEPSKDIVMLQFDEMTFRAYQERIGNWPWPRSVHADMIHYLNRQGAKAMAYDLMFIGRQRGREASDNYFIKTFAEAPNVYFSMNFDHDLPLLQARGQDLHWEDVEKIQPYAIALDNKLDAKNRELDLQVESGVPFYRNPNMDFNNYRTIMPELLAAKKHVAFINHAPDPDGVSRGNPLFYRFRFHVPDKSPYIPYGLDPKTGQYFDTSNHLVTQDGFLIGPDGKLQQREYALFFPYLAMRLFVDLKFPNEKVKFTLTPDGFLQFRQYKVPLTPQGSFLPRWYKVHVDEKSLKARLADLQRNNGSAVEISNIQASLERPKPYTELPGWKVLDAIYHEKDGLPVTDSDREVQAMVKDKVIFIGNTSVSGYDIKPTPIDRQMPGVFIQAATFDTLWRNDGYIRHMESHLQLFLTFFMCLMGVSLVFRFNSILLEFVGIIVMILIYVLGACLAFKMGDVWIDIVVPLFIMLACVLLAIGIKYFLRSRDYEKTYAQANTDSMTGLYNHHFFKKHMQTSIDRAKQFNLHFALVLIDIDFFKKFNDSYGHQAGDEVLRCVAKKLKDQVRSVDVVCRYGGEEMAIILDGADNDAALRVAQKVVDAIAAEAYPIAEGVEKHVTISVGVATFPDHGKTTVELVEFSDKGLYAAKENGRNQVGKQPVGEAPEAL